MGGDEGWEAGEYSHIRGWTQEIRGGKQEGKDKYVGV